MSLVPQDITPSKSPLQLAVEMYGAEALWKRLSLKERYELLYDWTLVGRPEQQMPPGQWRTWVYLAGRGAGKTRTASETVRRLVEAGQVRHVALVAETSADARDTMIELGESSIMQTARPDFAPRYEPSKRRLTWPNGATATAFSADKPGQLRGPQHDFAWCDELAKWRYPEETWSNLQFGLRLIGPKGFQPRAIVTTTPRPTKLLVELVRGRRKLGGGYEPNPRVVVTQGTTYDNITNLAAAFVEEVVRAYEGTKLGRQELRAAILDKIDGALWSLEMIDESRIHSSEEAQHTSMSRIVVAVDPPTTSDETSDDPAECGIIACGKRGDHLYTLEDASASGSPERWARRAVELYRRMDADCIVAEVNQGGDMVRSTIHAIDANVTVRMVRASRGKHTRAEPISALYEQGRVHHVGVFPKLEDQMATWVPGEDSPDRMDALVWGHSWLAGKVESRDIVAPRTVRLGV